MESLIENSVKDQGRIDFLYINFGGVVYGCHYVYPLMIEQGFGHIINTASLAGLIPGGLTTSYSASKYAVVGFTLTLRAEAKQYGIKVSALCPGYIRTNIQKSTENVSEFLNSEKNRKMNERMKFPAPEDCIDQIMRGVKRNKGIIIAPRMHKIFWLLRAAKEITSAFRHLHASRYLGKLFFPRSLIEYFLDLTPECLV